MTRKLLLLGTQSGKPARPFTKEQNGQLISSQLWGHWPMQVYSFGAVNDGKTRHKHCRDLLATGGQQMAKQGTSIAVTCLQQVGNRWQNKAQALP